MIPLNEYKVLRKKQSLDSNELKKGAGNVKGHLTWRELQKLGEEMKEDKLVQFFKYTFSVPIIVKHFNQPRHAVVPPNISNI